MLRALRVVVLLSVWALACAGKPERCTTDADCELGGRCARIGGKEPLAPADQQCRYPCSVTGACRQGQRCVTATESDGGRLFLCLEQND